MHSCIGFIPINDCWSICTHRTRLRLWLVITGGWWSQSISLLATLYFFSPDVPDCWAASYTAEETFKAYRDSVKVSLIYKYTLVLPSLLFRPLLFPFCLIPSFSFSLRSLHSVVLMGSRKKEKKPPRRCTVIQQIIRNSGKEKNAAATYSSNIEV